jgi:four helix bundle protein
MKSSVLYEKAYGFAVRIAGVYQSLSNGKKEFVLSKQILRAGTSIGANISEAGYAHTRPDFISKLSIAAKEANETMYWLRLLKDTNYITEEILKDIEQDLQELQRMLTASLKTAKANTKQ